MFDLDWSNPAFFFKVTLLVEWICPACSLGISFSGSFLWSRQSKTLGLEVFFYQILKARFSLKLLCVSVLTYISKVIRSVYQLQFSGYEIWIFEFKLYHSTIWLRREECSISYLTESSSHAREIAVTVQVFPGSPRFSITAASQSACA